MRGALAVHPGALGDVLLSIPALRALRARHGTVILAAQPHIARLVHALGVVDATCTIDRLGLDALFVDDDARARLFDAERVVCWLGARDPAFTRRLSTQASSVTVAPSVDAGVVWQHLLKTAALEAAALVDPVVISRPLREAGAAVLRGAGWDGRNRLLIVHPGAGSPAKRWPPNGFASAVTEVAAEHDVTVAVHQGPADADAVAALVPRLPAARVLAEPCLSTLAGALSHATAYLGNDSGISHLAAAIGIPAVVLFVEANTRWQPWSVTAMPTIVEAREVNREDAAAVAAALGGVLRRRASSTLL